MNNEHESARVYSQVFWPVRTEDSEMPQATLLIEPTMMEQWTKHGGQWSMQKYVYKAPPPATD